MTLTDLYRLIDEKVASLDLGVASAVKRGRNPDFPYVPICVYGHRTQNPIRKRAFATREEAVAAAQNSIDHLRAMYAAHMKEARYRALREYYGLPREMPTE